MQDKEERFEHYTKILRELIQIYSPSGQEQKLAEYIKETYDGKGSGWSIETDDAWNVYIRPENDDGSEFLPLLNAHLDTYPFHMEYTEAEKQDIKARRQEDMAFIPERSEAERHHIEALSREDVISLVDGSVVKGNEIQVGFDDKAGVAMILYLMRNTYLRFRAVLSTQEESAETIESKYDRFGGGGIEYALENKRSFFEPSSFVLTLDRHGATDVIATYGGGSFNQPVLELCNREFLAWFLEMSEAAGYPMQVAKGRIADAYNIRQAFPELDVLNISVGAYNEHSQTEQLELGEAMGVLGVVKACIESKRVM